MIDLIIINNLSLVVSGFLFALLLVSYNTAKYFERDNEVLRKELIEADNDLRTCKHYNRCLYNELGKFDKERCEYYFRESSEPAKFERVGGSE